MSLYDGGDASNWGFGFSVTELGSPFSVHLHDAVTACERAGWIARHDRVYRITEKGTIECAFQRSLAPNLDRSRYLAASVSASLVMTLPSIGDALNNEPGLRRAMAFLRQQQLLDETSLGLVNDQFEDLRSAVGGGESRGDLMVPTAVWLTFLAETADRKTTVAS
ncbi:hypothetical protein [Aeromicrobium sp.]|uniref:hypothetical protein n=1 Tax=Aeromicrobium sp. TaxID=1871063 RepID=UPI0040337C3B